MPPVSTWISNAFNVSVLQRKRYSWVDYLRGIVIILVVYHHAYLGLERSGLAVPKAVGDANMAFYSFRMPLFFIISGMFTSISLSNRSLKTLVWSKFNVLLYPYLVWAFLQVSLQIVLSHYTNSERTVADYLYILYQPKRLDQFWYLPALFNATIVFLLLKTQLRFSRLALMVSAIVLYLLAPFVNEISMLSNWMHFFIFVVIGDVISDFIFKPRVQHKLKQPYIFLLCLPVFAVVQYFYFGSHANVERSESDLTVFKGDALVYLAHEGRFLLTCFVGCATFICLAFLLEKWSRLKWLRIVGFHSLFIYIIHVIVVAFTRTLFTKVLGVENYLVILLAAIGMGIIIPIVFYNFVGKKYLWFLFTTRRPAPVAVEQNQKGGFSEPIAQSAPAAASR